ncbi:copper chaperone for superoxide dismutase-like [Hetaerina americana]|uniref:copper chaperone for superoxide dismutase-like n=1 Tax=Hetaerina americana TaxID=62018 RepID=UPI003A7F1FE7
MLQVFRSFLFHQVHAMDKPSSKLQANVPSIRTKMEFAVQMHCQNCVDSVKESLSGLPEISKIEVSLENESVIVESILSAEDILRLIENSGRKAILKGIGGIKKGGNLGAAVAVVGSTDPKNIGFGWSDTHVYGVVRFIQTTEDECIIEGVLDGLTPGLHGIHIHEYGDISQGCNSVGDHYNPMNKRHGSPYQDDGERHVGDLGNIFADQHGRATFKIVDQVVKTWDIIGRSVAVTEREDDLGLGGNKGSAIDGNSGRRLACGIISRSAGLFGNPKRVCACDGTTIWEEASGVAGRKGEERKTVSSREKSDPSSNPHSKY